ncbi:hypothetical protein PUNSTDRAFT_137726 [Punctularia strigosozonata HHB-11173 SS5]|uniref:uncharacterized protein n=1 Tax=Punctularia strigosozonata (strain HHB-11173) TaxID=741275 RepID=UPI00044184E1|nr:uncharacterized protein PUNSTDRAFT_137726 [Punctularia strigosozonata HHB-11173 SS5]EIN05627.1 hypothetical protein PUNSTDRAFT_137726 [Punctularia strigosozonata HHB-11173 SS5]
MASRQPTNLASLPRSRTPSPGPGRYRGAFLEIGYQDSEFRRHASRSSVDICLEPMQRTSPYTPSRGHDLRSISSPEITLREENRRGEDVPVEGTVVQSMQTLAVPAAGPSRPHTPVPGDSASVVSIVVHSPEVGYDGRDSDTALTGQALSYDIGVSRTSSPSASEVHVPLPTMQSLAEPYHNPARPNAGSRERNRPSLDDHGIFPIDTHSVNRYARNFVVPSHKSGLQLPPMTMDYIDTPLPLGWDRYVHPEGPVYYHHPTENFLTDARICDPDVYEKIQTAMKIIEEVKHSHGSEFPQDAEIVLELPSEGDGKESCYYYCVNHQERILFWLDVMDLHSTIGHVLGVENMSHIKVELSAHYWTHWEYFPLQRRISEDLLRELLGIMMHSGVGNIDMFTSRRSTSPYTHEEVMTIMEFVKNVNYVQEIGGYSACVVGRMMALFHHNRFLHFHGQHAARLNYSQPLHAESQHPPTLLITVVSPLLFFAPDIHLRHFRMIWVDKIVHEHAWRKFVEKIQQEWDKFLLPSTVLLSVNVAFLAIPSVDQTNQAPNFISIGGNSTFSNLSNFDFDLASPQRSWAQILSYISTTASIGTIILGMILDRHYRLNHHMSAADASDTLQKRAHPFYGLEVLSILYALPYALLMWGMVTFAVSCFLLFFDSTTARTRIMMGILSAMCTIAVFWCISTTWDDHHSWSKQLSTAIKYKRPNEDYYYYESDSESSVQAAGSNFWKDKYAGIVMPRFLRLFTSFRRREMGTAV